MSCTLNQGLSWMKTLKSRHSELVALRNENSSKESRVYGSKESVDLKTPEYSVKHLDKLVNQVAKEIRKLDDAIKQTNAVTTVIGYEKNEDVLGELEEKE